jgi:predicted metal-dependent phosphotriesterase family hydrolase
MAWLLGSFAAAMAARGIGSAEQALLFVANPARAFAFARTDALLATSEPTP